MVVVEGRLPFFDDELQMMMKTKKVILTWRRLALRLQLAQFLLVHSLAVAAGSSDNHLSTFVVCCTAAADAAVAAAAVVAVGGDGSAGAGAGGRLPSLCRCRVGARGRDRSDLRLTSPDALSRNPGC